MKQWGRRGEGLEGGKGVRGGERADEAGKGRKIARYEHKRGGRREAFGE